MLTRTGLGVGAGALLLAALGLRLGYVEFIVAGLTALGLLIVGYVATRRRLAVRAERLSIPVRVPRGTPVPTRVLLTIDAPLPSSTSSVVDSIGELATECPIDDGSTVLAYELPPADRGVHPVGPIEIRRTDPFGLLTRERPIGGVGEIVVHPRVLPLRGHIGPGRLSTTDAGRRRAADDPLAGFQSMRDYVPGDDTRAIHWPTTAKAGRLMVREFVDPRRPTYAVVLQTTASDYAPGAFEEAADIAASLVAHVLAFDHDVVIRTTDPRHVGPPAPIRRLDEALDLLARVQGTDALGTVPLTRVVGEAMLGSTVLVITGTTDHAALELGALASRVVPILVGGAERRPSVSAAAIVAENATHFAELWDGTPL